LDYDGDGLLDLYVANYVDFSLDAPLKTMTPYMAPGGRIQKGVTAYPHPDNFLGVPDVLYHNNGDGTFTDVTRKAGVFNLDEGKGMGMACGDYDNDGDVDIYVGNDRTPNFLYRNNGGGTFTDMALMAGQRWVSGSDCAELSGGDLYAVPQRRGGILSGCVRFFRDRSGDAALRRMGRGFSGLR
jgi:hypothetical protein